MYYKEVTENYQPKPNSFPVSPMYRENFMHKSEKSDHKKFPKWLLILILVVLVAIGGFVAMKIKRSSSRPAQQFGFDFY